MFGFSKERERKAEVMKAREDFAKFAHEQLLTLQQLDVAPQDIPSVIKKVGKRITSRAEREFRDEHSLDLAESLEEFMYLENHLISVADLVTIKGLNSEQVNKAFSMEEVPKSNITMKYTHYVKTVHLILSGDSFQAEGGPNGGLDNAMVHAAKNNDCENPQLINELATKFDQFSNQDIKTLLLGFKDIYRELNFSPRKVATVTEKLLAMYCVFGLEEGVDPQGTMDKFKAGLYSAVDTKPDKREIEETVKTLSGRNMSLHDLETIGKAHYLALEDIHSLSLLTSLLQRALSKSANNSDTKLDKSSIFVR